MIGKMVKFKKNLFPQVVQKHQLGEVGNKNISSSRIFFRNNSTKNY